MSTWLRQTQHQLGAVGLNAWGVAQGEAYEHILPGCRSVVVVGSGGGALWDAFIADLRATPAHAELPHPLDAFVQRQLDALPASPTRRWVTSAIHAETFVDFRPLALAAGLGWSSRLGLLLHPTFGPWLGLRAACFTTELLPPTGALPSPAPCEACDAPCAAACPVDALSGPSFDWRRSQAFQTRDNTCHGGCLAREACPEGAAQRYSAAEHRYHQHEAGRSTVLAALLASPER